MNENEYLVTVSRQCRIRIKTNSPQDAEMTVKKMSEYEITKLADFDNYDVISVEEIEKSMFYYVLNLKNKGIGFFRSDKKLDNSLDIVQYAVVETDIINSADECISAQEVNEENYREGILDCLSAKLKHEHKCYLDSLKSYTPEKFIEQVPQIYFYSDMIHALNDCSCSEDFELDSIEKLLSLDKPLEYLYDEKYCELDFSNTNEQMIGLFNSVTN